MLPPASIWMVFVGCRLISSPLIALNAVEEGGFFKRLWHALLMWWAE